MAVENPLWELRVECSNALNKALSERYPGLSVQPESLSTPPSIQLGELSSSMCLSLIHI